MEESDEHLAGTGPPPVLRVDRRSLVVLAGLPGAGKSTALGKSRTEPGVVVLDSEQVRAVVRRRLPANIPYRWYRPVVHLTHRSRIAWYCAAASGPVLAHEPSTRASTRAMLVVLGWLTGRRRVLLWLHAAPREALAGQHTRGRLIRERSFRKHVRRAVRTRRALREGNRPLGWHAVRVFTRRDLEKGLLLRIRR